MPNAQFTNELKSKLRPVAEALIRKDDERRNRAVDRATRGGTTVVLSETVGNLPGNRHGVIPDESVEVSIASLPTLVSQELFNEFVVAALAASTFDVNTILTNADGDVVVNAEGNVLVSG